MSHVLIHHKVAKYESWKKVFDSHAEFRRSSGEKSYQIFRSHEDPNSITLLFEWESSASAKKFQGSDNLKAAMKEAGVVGPPEIQYLDAVTHGAHKSVKVI
ncbi:MAG: antibiotic biosynthesis monooxygenase [Candidatus Eisenbacteria bacterium]|uniref:Antibiotic biosynthesis monooxygenase n=1 Tax=Eiseniibacteriota bacterium TaxID=2212470 RepID=A0A948RTY6_UNCEI|nr:antibiotic biosynthesis monooxygenase [Candidatus Eisenbacteria bacterium]MBU1950551.1 antibiotic biosynthesis monooxygenase [Candidatus Eisenbacteria bacterium]MBU2690963.1 antibiotic biosynthesis monooxygenase [Candidatus Eisenbacteria bacterium]